MLVSWYLWKTYLNNSGSEASLHINGFGSPLWLDRDSEVTQNLKGGAVRLYINRRWSNNFAVQEQFPDKELLSVSVRLFYLSRELPQVFVAIV